MTRRRRRRKKRPDPPMGPHGEATIQLGDDIFPVESLRVALDAPAPVQTGIQWWAHAVNSWGMAGPEGSIPLTASERANAEVIGSVSNVRTNDRGDLVGHVAMPADVTLSDSERDELYQALRWMHGLERTDSDMIERLTNDAEDEARSAMAQLDRPFIDGLPVGRPQNTGTVRVAHGLGGTPDAVLMTGSPTEVGGSGVSLADWDAVVNDRSGDLQSVVRSLMGVMLDRPSDNAAREALAAQLRRSAPTPAPEPPPVETIKTKRRVRF